MQPVFAAAIVAAGADCLFFTFLFVKPCMENPTLLSGGLGSISDEGRDKLRNATGRRT